MSPDEAGKAVDNFIEARDSSIQEISRRMTQLENRLNKAKAQYAEFKQQAKETADAAAHTGAIIAPWSFFGLLAGDITSALAGLLGVNTHPAYRKCGHNCDVLI